MYLTEHSVKMKIRLLKVKSCIGRGNEVGNELDTDTL